MNAHSISPNSDATSRTALARWMDRPWFFTLWTVLAAFGSYACMYGFRKPFTAGTCAGTEWGPQLKVCFVTAQVLGYMLSKIVGIKVIGEMTAARRAAAFLGIVAVAELALALFAVTPVPFSAVWLFVNGLALGMIFGLVLGFLEGRCLTELFVAGLCASFVLADGVAKSVGSALLQSGVPERWMPCVAGLIFALPLVVFVWMLKQIPAPTAQDEATRSRRSPMNRADRLAMLRRHGVGLFAIMFAYLLITVLRSIRADFAPDIWAGLGLGNQPAIFTQSESWVTLAVVIADGAIADAVGYLGYAGVILARSAFPSRESFLGFFTHLSTGLLAAALAAMLGALVFYARRSPRPPTG